MSYLRVTQKKGNSKKQEGQEWTMLNECKLNAEMNGIMKEGC